MNKVEQGKSVESKMDWVIVDVNGRTSASTSSPALTPPKTPEPYIASEPSSKKKITPLFEKKLKDAREHKSRHRERENQRAVARKLKFGADE